MSDPAVVTVGRGYWMWTFLMFPGWLPVIAQVTLILAIAGFSVFVIVRYREGDAPRRAPCSRRRSPSTPRCVSRR